MMKIEIDKDVTYSYPLSRSNKDIEGRGLEMGYVEHFKINMIVAGKSLLLFAFHFAHALIPCQLTDHNAYNINLEERKKRIVR